MTIDKYLELISVLLSLFFLVLIIKEKRSAWVFGIVGSAISALLFYRSKLYSETILYLFYAIMGIYGLWYWNRSKQSIPVTHTSIRLNIQLILLGIGSAWLLGYYFDKYTSADLPYFDSTTTSFSFVATFLEARKKLTAWIYWIILNGATVVLYYYKELNLYSALQIIYFVMSFVGYYQWKKSLRLALNDE